MNFASDNVTGAAPEILEALARGAGGAATPYGDDAATERLAARLAELLEHPVRVFPVATGTAANALALSVLAPPYGAVYCHEEAHIEVDECGAPELYTGGAKLVPVPGAHGRLGPADLDDRLARAGAGVVHHVQPAALSLTQATEAGTVYRPAEIAALAEVARRHGLGVHLDGARFANAVATLGCAPADLTWRAGVDILCLGATKNGCLAAEAIVLFDDARAEALGFRRKRGGHLLSKMRFVSLQLEAWLADDLWLRLARHANAQAARLAEGLARVPGVRLVHPVEANEVFVALPPAVRRRLQDHGVGFIPWDETTDRLVAAFDTPPEVVDAVVAIAAG